MIISVLVYPNSKYPSIEIDDDIYIIRVQAVADKNKANKEVIELLASYFKIKKSNIQIIRGEKNRNKTILIDRI